MDLIDSINETMNLLKQQTIELKDREAEVEMYKQMLNSGHQSIGNSEFLILSTEFDGDAVNIVLANFDEFGSSAYDHGFGLTARYESDRNCNTYLSPLKEDANLTEMTKVIDELVEKKRQNYLETRKSPSFKATPQTKYLTLLIEKNNEKLEQQANRLHEKLMKQLQEMKMSDDNIIRENKKLQEKLEGSERIIKDQERKIEDYLKNIEELEQKIEEQTKKMEENEQKLEGLTEKKEEQIRKLLEPINIFLNQKNFEIITSFSIMDGLGNRLYKREEGDTDRCEPPLKQIHPLEQRRKEVLDYIEYVKINWNNRDSGTDIQKNIHDWFYYNRQIFMFNPSEEEKESSRKMFLNKIKLENTIGTIHFLPIYFSDRIWYFCFAICNYRIVYWDYNYSQRKVFSDIYNYLKQLPTWTKNAKFATEMEVDDEQSDIFIHTSNKDVFVENEQVVTWIENNFNLDQQNNKYLQITCSIIPSLYNFFVNFYDSSSIG